MKDMSQSDIIYYTHTLPMLPSKAIKNLLKHRKTGKILESSLQFINKSL